jgi:hypothetical protein
MAFRISSTVESYAAWFAYFWATYTNLFACLQTSKRTWKITCSFPVFIAPLLWVKGGRPVRKADNLTAICEPIV